jgi:hypothetical protein
LKNLFNVFQFSFFYNNISNHFFLTGIQIKLS